MRLSTKIAVIVGAGQSPGEGMGNGRATALRFAAEGAKLLAIDRDITSAEETTAMVRAEGGDCTAFEADVTDEDTLKAAMAFAVERWGRIDILHNNVGIGAGDRGPTSMTEEVWDRIHTTNLKSVMFTCKHVLPVMRAQRSGVIINISSIAAVCSVGIVAYKTSKAAVNAFTQSLAIGNGEFNIRANVIMPGLMNTPMAVDTQYEDLLRHVLEPTHLEGEEAPQHRGKDALERRVHRGQAIRLVHHRG